MVASLHLEQGWLGTADVRVDTAWASLLEVKDGRSESGEQTTQEP